MGSREYIKDKKGECVRDEHGDRLFYSTEDGDSHPESEQKVYREFDTPLGKANSLTDRTYNPSQRQVQRRRPKVEGV